MSTDQQLTCANCNRTFTFTADEQNFYAERGFSTPRKCKPCRDAAKAERGGGRGFGGRGGGEGREMHEVTCAQCGVVTTVPFKPTSGRPVYCRDCFRR